MTIGGLSAESLAKRFGTPMLAIDLDVFDAALDDFLRAGERHGVRVSYAAKALLVTALARHLQPLPVGIDVVSLGELATCERAGIEASRLTLHGAGKLDDEIAAAFEGRVGRLVVDSVDELERVVALSAGRSLDVLLRINTGIEAHTHEFIRTAGDDSKFGLAPRDEARAFALLASQPSLRLVGVHGHVGSQVYEIEPFAANTQALAAALTRCREAGFHGADTIVTGGGFGVRMHPSAGDETLDVDRTFAAIRAAAPHAKLEVEPGRAVVAEAGTSIYRVMAIKRFAQRTFVVVDGGMADNPRPALYGAYHHIRAVGTSSAADIAVTICGRSCENDELGDALLPADIRAGDLLAVETTGAYTYSMASNYNRFPRPPVVAVTKREAQLWTRRETIEDVLRADV